MPKHTPAQAKNAIRRALRAVIDPELKKKHTDELWSYFESRCAYCDSPLDREQRQGQMDHLVPTNRGGTNHFSNRVLACAPCNGDHRREKDWMGFLQEMVPDPAARAERRERIERWQTAVAPSAEVADAEFLQRETARVLAAFDSAVASLRRSRLTRVEGNVEQT